MKKYFLMFVFLSSFGSMAKSIDSTKVANSWIPKLVLGLNLSQIAFSNWIKGGENSVTWTVLTDFDLKYKTESWSVKNDFNIAYGRTKLGEADFRTNENEINLETVVSYNASWVVDPFFSNSIRTQVTRGYDYEKDPNKTIVNFFDPGYITQSFGFTYDKLKFGTTRFGVAVQETFTNFHTQYSDDTETEKVEKFKFETGVESVTDTEVEIDTNIKLESKLRLFTRFEKLEVWDVRFSNKFVSKINSYLQVNIDLMLIYEKSQSLKTQMKEAFQLGIKYNLL